MRVLTAMVLAEMSYDEVCRVVQILARDGNTDEVLRAMDDVLIDRPDSWEAEARAFYEQGRRVAGIKVCRAATGKGLKEALDYCDAHFPRGDL